MSLPMQAWACGLLSETTSPNHVRSYSSNIWPVQIMSCRRIQIPDQLKPCNGGWFKYLASPNHVLVADSNIWPNISLPSLEESHLKWIISIYWKHVCIELKYCNHSLSWGELILQILEVKLWLSHTYDRWANSVEVKCTLR